MKPRPKKKVRQPTDGAPFLILPQKKKQKSNVERLHDEIQANLRSLQTGARYSRADAGNCVTALIEAAVRATEILQAFYGSGLEGERELVRKVALRREKFVGTYEFRLPMALRAKPRKVETRGDEIRRDLTNEWQATAHLRAKSGTEYDFLRLSIEGFARAVRKPESSTPPRTSGEPSTTLDWFLEIEGAVSVPNNMRDELLKPSARSNATKWADAYVKWYETLHPWPMRDNLGAMIWPKSAEALPNQIHKVAFLRLMKLQKANPDEKSPLNALRAVVRERFEAAFSEVKVERDSDL